MDVKWIVVASVGMFTSCYILSAAKVVINFKCCMNQRLILTRLELAARHLLKTYCPGKVREVLVMLQVTAWASTETVVWNFGGSGDGNGPTGNLIADASGNPKLMGDLGLLVRRNIDTTISVHFVCGFHIEIGNAYLPRSLGVEHPQRLTDDRKVLNFTPATVAKINGRAMQHLVS
jgi:hypothetical protein